MDSTIGFHEVENDGKFYLMYYNPKNYPSPSPSRESASHRKSHPLYISPNLLCISQEVGSYLKMFSSSKSPPEYILSTTTSSQSDDYPWDPDQLVLPLFLCNNKEFELDGGCNVCRVSNLDTNYYFCKLHGRRYQKEIVEPPLQIKHPYHPEHPLQLFFHYYNALNKECLCCGRITNYLVYHCTICQVFMHPICSLKPIPFVIDQPKRHDHPLTFFLRQISLTCNVCGLVRKNYPTFVCLRCNFVAHKDCMYSPHTIKISRHHHRISYISSLRSGEWSCGVCRQSINGDYGAYSCGKCDDYVVHSRCALRKDVWDGEELEGVPEEDDISLDAGPFDIISEGVIRHFLHDDHHLSLDVNILYDENKICQACVLPIYEGNVYSCMECDFILHEACAEARRRIQHALHPHPLTLEELSRDGDGAFKCTTCERYCSGFVYWCSKEQCNFNLDVRCASISEPFDYKGHEDPLFLALDPDEKPICKVCKLKSKKQLNCIKCDFIVCFKCTTLPYKARYKHDKHFLTLLCGEDVCEEDWCEACERKLGDTRTKMFYWCDKCCTTLHISCLLSQDPYMKTGKYFKLKGKEVPILNRKLSWSFCDSCKKLCQGKLFKRDNKITCSLDCWFSIYFEF